MMKRVVGDWWLVVIHSLRQQRALVDDVAWSSLLFRLLSTATSRTPIRYCVIIEYDERQCRAKNHWLTIFVCVGQKKCCKKAIKKRKKWKEEEVEEEKESKKRSWNLIPYFEKAVPWACCYGHTVFGYTQTTYTIIVTSENSCSF